MIYEIEQTTEDEFELVISLAVSSKMFKRMYKMARARYKKKEGREAKGNTENFSFEVPSNYVAALKSPVSNLVRQVEKELAEDNFYIRRHNLKKAYYRRAEGGALHFEAHVTGVFFRK